MNKQLIHSF